MDQTRTVQDAINDYWSTHAQAYDAHQVAQLGHPEVQQAWEQAWAAVLPQPPADVLDLGTGSGHVALTLATLGHRVTGIDLAQGMLEQARRKGTALPTPPTFRTGDAMDPPFEPAAFDALVSRYVLWTLQRPHEALLRWKTLLRPGGVLAAVDSTWFPDGIEGPDTTGLTARQAHFRASYDERARAQLPLAEATSIDDTVALVAAAGFTAVQVTPLRDLHAVEARVGVVPGHDLQLQFLITARAPG